MSERRRIRVGILFGGQSAEHEVSLQSARNILEAIDPETYDVVLLGIDREGRWHLTESSSCLLNETDPRRIRLGAADRSVALIPGDRADLVSLSGRSLEEPLDVVFPVLHGPMGEDGTVQGLFRLAHLPFVGAGVLGSSLGMDKDVTKRLLRDAGIPTARFVTLRMGEEAAFEDLADALGVPFFVKPANMGSSVGVTRVSDAGAWPSALEEAFRFDRKVLVEAGIEGRELECAVLGNDAPIASVPGEVIPSHEFYSYEAKYLDEKGARLEIPADLPEEVARRVRELAIHTFRTLCCEGMARVDFFLTKDGDLLVSELNSIPGFTRISMYPKLWEASGIGYSELIDRLIRLALERAEREGRLETRVEL